MISCDEKEYCELAVSADERMESAFVVPVACDRIVTAFVLGVDNGEVLGDVLGLDDGEVLGDVLVICGNVVVVMGDVLGLGEDVSTLLVACVDVRVVMALVVVICVDVGDDEYDDRATDKTVTALVVLVLGLLDVAALVHLPPVQGVVTTTVTAPDVNIGMTKLSDALVVCVISATCYYDERHM